jgi:hypothetical protein
MLTLRQSKKREFIIRELTRDELPRLLEPRGRITVKKLRDSHHRVARLMALGLRIEDVVIRSGYAYQTIYNLSRDPAFQELVAHYRNLATESFVASADEYYDLATRNMIAAERHIADAIEEADENGELLPIKTAIAISRDAADRFGYGKKQTNLNVNVDFAKNLEGMLRRSGKTLEGTASPMSSSTPPPVAVAVPSPPRPPRPEAALAHRVAASSAPEQQPMRRRA